MDECIIHSQFLTLANENSNTYRQYEEGRPTYENSNSNNNNDVDEDEESGLIIPSSCESFRLCLPDGDRVHVTKRPNLDYFLQEVTRRYKTYIFTAAMEIYASPLLDRLDPHANMFAGRFYRESCTYDSSLGVFIKDLDNIKTKSHYDEESKTNDSKNESSSHHPSSTKPPLFHEEKVVLIDNNPFSFLANPKNGILVSNFYDDPKDDTLKAVLDLLDELDRVDDVRPILDKKFGLRDALREVSNTQRWT